MGFLYLFLALFAGIAKGYCGKTVSRDMSSFKECIFINLMRMLFCALVGFILMIINANPFAEAVITKEAYLIYFMASISMSVFCVAWMYAYQNEAYIFLNVFTMLGTIVTCILDFAFYNADICINQWIGMILLLFAVYIMSIYNKGIKGKLTTKGIIILITGSLGAALADFSQKVYVRQIGENAQIFNFYMYTFGFIILSVIFVALKGKNFSKIPKLLFSKKNLIIYFAMAFFLYMNSLTKTMAASFLSSAQIYPVLQGANLILSALMAHFIFKEKMNLKGVFGITIAFVALLIMNMM